MRGLEMNEEADPEAGEIQLSAEEQAELWRQWVEKGPQGPIPDEDAELP
jgi:hypothetical protein